MLSLRRFCLSVAWFLACPVTFAQLRPDTLQAWNDYLEAAEARTRRIAAEGGLMPGEEPSLRAQLRAGRIPAVNALSAPKRLPHATLQDWAGAVFVPGTKLDDVFSVVRDYDRYADYYAPVIRSSQLLEHADGVRKFRLRYVRKALFAVIAVDMEYESHDCRVTDRHWYSMTRSTAVHQIRNFGEPGEYALPEDDRDAYVWRAENLMQFDEGDGGVYVAQESIVLGHPIPKAWRWLVEPFVDRMARQLVTTWLGQMRDASTAASRGVRERPKNSGASRLPAAGTTPGC